MFNRFRFAREWEFYALLVIAAGIYLTRLGDAWPTGEEPRRGQVAREMIESGDWIVPRQQGCPFLSRPPVQNWAIALVALVRGKIDALTIRLPSGLAMLAAAAMIYGYSRTFLSRLGAFTSGISFLTMFLVLQFGWLGETESLYTFIVAGSLLFWRWADVTKKPAIIAWSIGYGLAGLGMLTKGPQAPVYFAGGVVLYLIYQRRFRDLFRWQHFFGIALFFAIWLSWEIPFANRVSSDAAWVMLMGDIAMRFEGNGASRWAMHLVEYPAGLLASTLPWSALLAAYFHRDFRKSIADRKDDISFLAISAGFMFFTCLVAPGARNRYFAPALPLIAPLIGLVAQQCVEMVSVSQQQIITQLRTLARRFFLGHAFLFPIGAIWIIAATIGKLGPSCGEQTLLFAAIYALAAIGAAAALVWASRQIESQRFLIGVAVIACFLGLTQTGALMNNLVALRQPIGDNVAKLSTKLPHDAHLVSIGPVDDIFIYYYAKPIQRLPDTSAKTNSDANWEYFCMGCGPNMPAVDFPYEKLGEVSVEASYSENPRDKVIIGRRLPNNLARRTNNTTNTYYR